MRINTIVVAALALTALGLPSTVSGQGVPFPGSTIDPTFSGDCKALGDIDGDGRMDPIVAGDAMHWYEAGAGLVRRTIRASVVYTQFTTDMQAADVDGDGDTDVIVGDGDGTGNVLWFVNPRLNPPAGVGSDPRITANWTFRIIGTHGETAHDIETGDLDNDGLLDIVTSGHGFTRIWKQNSPTSWSSRDISSVAGSGISIGDVDRDGFRDLATPRGWVRNPHSITSGTWTFNAVDQTSGDECLIVDLNGDGRLDLLTCEAHFRGPVYWFEAPAAPTSTTWTRRTLDPSMGAHHPEAADFDGDGRQDILLGLELAEVSIYLNGGGTAPSFEKVAIANNYGHNARAGDINGDQRPDILACDWIGHPPVRVYMNKLPGATPCYPNCDASTGQPALTANDFTCFINRYATADPWANCDGSAGNPLLTANDFVCFINAYAQGCP